MADRPRRTEAEGDDGELVVVASASIYGVKTRRGMVELSIGETKVQLPVAKARSIHRQLGEAIEAAISDELFVAFLTGPVVGLTLEQAAAALGDFREMRQGTRDTLIEQ